MHISKKHFPGGRKPSVLLTTIFLVMVAALQTGCSTGRAIPEPAPVVVAPEPPATQFQTSLGRVAVAVKVDLPELRFMRYARDPALANSMSRGSFPGCGGGNIGACVLVGLTVGVVAGAIESAATDRKSRAVKGSDEIVSPKLESSIIQEGLRDAIMAAANSDGVKLSIAPAVGTVEPEGASDYRALAAKGIDTVLEVTLHQVFREPNNFDSKGRAILDPLLPLDLETHVRLIRTRDNSVLLQEDYAYHGKRYQYTQWAANNGAKLTEGLKKGDVALGRDIADRVFLLYPFADRIGDGESGHCGLGILEPRENMADDLSPLLAWKSFPRPSDVGRVPDDMKRVKNVRYELLVGSGGNGETPDELYHVEGLTETSHRVPMRLEPNTRYFWSVRAKFDLDGRIRVTDWATYCPFGKQLVVGSSIYRFYTPKTARADTPKEVRADSPNTERADAPMVGRVETEKWVKGPGW